MCRIIDKPSSYVLTASEEWNSTLIALLEQAKVESKHNSRLRSVLYEIEEGIFIKIMKDS